MSVDPPHTSTNVEENYRGKYMELVLAHCVSKDAGYFITIQENYRGPDSSMCHKAYQKHNQANLYIKLGPHKYRCKKQGVIQYVSSPIKQYSIIC
jgi:hypothetical protein